MGGSWRNLFRIAGHRKGNLGTYKTRRISTGDNSELSATNIKALSGENNFVYASKPKKDLPGRAEIKSTPWGNEESNKERWSGCVFHRSTFYGLNIKMTKQLSID